MKPRALVAGVIRNGGNRLRKSVRALDRALSSDFDIEYFVVESDSIDGTQDELRQIQCQKTNFGFTSLGHLQPSVPDRLQRLAICRNEYMRYFDENIHKFEFLVVADLDGINMGLLPKALSFLKSFDGDYGGLFANQSGPYYDIGALRCKGWCERDPFSQLNDLVAAGVDFESAQSMAISSKMVRIRSSSRPIPVESAFGGLAIHPAAAVSGGRYSTGTHNEVEIVEFNRDIVRKTGLPLFIIPSMLNSRYTEHTSQFSPMGRFVYWATRALRKSLLKLVSKGTAERLSEFERRLFGR